MRDKSKWTKTPKKRDLGLTRFAAQPYGLCRSDFHEHWVECKFEVESVVSMVTAQRLDIVQQFGGVAKPRPLCWKLYFDGECQEFLGDSVNIGYANKCCRVDSVLP
jgi:hypothetical protein